MLVYLAEWAFFFYWIKMLSIITFFCMIRIILLYEPYGVVTVY